MGTGKTTIAKQLAARSGRKYVSLDDMIEKKEGKKISDIFRDKGEPYFRAAESEAVREASALDNAIIDAGGGAVIDPYNVKNLKKNGVLICLWADPKDIYERTKNFGHRPILNVPDPMAKIKALLEERKPYYERADHHINTSGMSADEAVNSIIKLADRSKNGPKKD